MPRVSWSSEQAILAGKYEAYCESVVTKKTPWRDAKDLRVGDNKSDSRRYLGVYESLSSSFASCDDRLLVYFLLRKYQPQNSPHEGQ